MLTQPETTGEALADTAWLERIAKHRIDAIAKHCQAPLLEPRANRFAFLRHGETQGNHLRIFQHAEIELNQTGMEQAAQAASLLAAAGLARLIASDMTRTWQTASILANSLGVAPIAEPRLRERWFGDLVGTSSADLDWSLDPPNGDRLADFVSRTRNGLQAALDSNEPTLLVAHGGTLYVLAYSLGVGLGEAMVKNATPLLFERRETVWTVTPVTDIALTRGGNIGW